MYVENNLFVLFYCFKYTVVINLKIIVCHGNKVVHFISVKYEKNLHSN